MIREKNRVRGGVRAEEVLLLKEEAKKGLTDSRRCWKWKRCGQREGKKGMFHEMVQ